MLSDCLGTLCQRGISCCPVSVCLSVTSPSFVEATGRIEKIFDTEVCLDLSYTLCCKEFRVGTLSPKTFLDRIACVAGMTCRVDRIPACDGQTDGHLAIKCHAVCMHYIYKSLFTENAVATQNTAAQA